MINMQQLILGQESGSSEQPQEEVQLTELLPVKQSRIRENNVFKDIDATDALKALRSYSGDCDGEEQQQDFGLRIFEEKKNENEKEEIKVKRGRPPKRKSNNTNVVDNSERKRRVNTNDREIDRPEVMANSKGGGSSATSKGRNAKRRHSKRTIKSSSNKRAVDKIGIVDTIDKKDNTEEEEEEEEEEEGEDEEEEEKYKNDDEIPTHLNLDKTKDSLNDEVYVFRRERSNSCSLLQTGSGEVNRDNKKNNDTRRENDRRTTSDGIKTRQFLNRSKKSSKIGKDELKNASVSKEGKTIVTNDDNNTRKELRLRIDEIIQGKYLVERQKNNFVSRNTRRRRRRRTKSDRKDSTSSTASSSSSPSQLPPSSSSSSSVKTRGASATYSDDEDTKRSEKDGSNKKRETKNSPKKYFCVVCHARFKGSGGLRNHYKVFHTTGPVYKCDECGKEFPLKERLKLHVRTHTGFRPYKCPECDKSFARSGQLVQHRRTHSQIKPYRCTLCTGTFTCAANLALHVKRHKGQKDHKCEVCGRGFVRRDALKKHLECLHRDVKSFLCVICNKTFKGHLPQHMRTHARDRPHGCATCGQRFAQKSQLTVHQRTHSGQRPFRCLVCWQAFAHSTALKLHTRRHTGERPFKCVECDAGFTQLPHWKKHMKCIHGRSEPYDCKRCKSFFRIKSDLESHEKSCHPDVETDHEGSSSNSFGASNDSNEKLANTARYRTMTVERMRLLLAVLLKRISKQERLDELGFGKRLIDKVLHDSLISAGKDPANDKGLTELETLTKNLETFLEWTVPKEHWENFRRMKKSPEDILETLTTT